MAPGTSTRWPPVARRRGQHSAAREEREGGDRHIDEQAPAPVQVLSEGAAEKQAEGATGASDRAEYSEGFRPLPRLRERHRQQRQRRRREQRRARALRSARREQGTERRRGPAGRGGCREPGQADEEGPAPADRVGDAPAEYHQAAERERVRGHDPLALRIGDLQGPLRGRESDVDDGRVEGHHELRDRDANQGQPAAGRLGGGGRAGTGAAVLLYVRGHGREHR